MFNRWYTMKRNGVPTGTPSNSMMEDDSTNCDSDPVALSTEPEQVELGEAQHSANTHPDAYPDKYVNHVPRQDSSAVPGAGYSESTLSVSSPGTFEGEKAPPYESTCSSADNRKNFKPSVPVREGGREEIQDSTSPQGHSTHDDAKPVYLGSRPKNVILFGETGVGKSSVINLMAGREIAKTSANLKGCTLEATEYWFGLSEDMALRIFDTVGLEEPEIGVNSFMGAIEKAHKLVQSLHSSGGIDLLLFCIRGGRITAAMQRSYRMFYEILCGSQVPLAIIVTNLERENVMEDWWVKNENTFQEYGIRPVAHACITAVPAHITMYAQKRDESQKTLRKVLLDTLTNPRPPYVRDIRSWLAAIIYLLRSFLVKSESLKKKDLTKRLEKRCRLPRDDAEKLAQMLVGGGLIDAGLV